MKTYHSGSESLVEFADVAYYFSIKDAAYGETNTIVGTAASVIKPEPLGVSGGYQVVPEGTDNRFPYLLQQLIEDNNLANGILTRQRGLQYGQGLALYTVEFQEGRRVVQWSWDETIGKELENWDYEEYLMNVLMDLIIKREYYTKIIGNRGIRIGKQGVPMELRHVPAADCRREWPDAKGVIKNIFVADWRNGDPDVLERYPMFDLLKGVNQPTAIHYESFYQFGRNKFDYKTPGFHGARKWMQRSNVAPDILKAQTDNGLNIKWHIISPQSYWDNKRDIIKGNCTKKGVEYNEKMLEDLKDQILQGLSKVLAGIDNTGKFFHSESVMSELGIGRSELMKWEIVPIDMKVKDFTEAQIEISKRADSAITSGAGLHPSLANIIVDGKLASGSEQLYAYKLFIATETPIMQAKALKVMNIWKKLRFPNVPGQFGFYHDIVKREEDLTASARTNANDN
jgi:hypothetical protein